MDEVLTLVDWRTRMAGLYDRVRAAPDPAVGHDVWTRGRAELFASHPQSPLRDRPDLREAGIDYWPYDPALRFELPLLDAEDDRRDADGGGDGPVSMRRVGRLEVPELGSLDVWWLHQYAGGVFVPLKDGTSGDGSYGGGRYLLDSAKGAWLGGDAGPRVVLDLNFAYHPSCRYDDRWRCPLAPPGNTVAGRVEAGERL